ncbi:small ribosomal subunit protein uS10m isoform X2 [Sinocyclocheilus anshuiensis]|uniref:small ribosomal subunit protein uS10m isoform X2 n=1 Tax=Sinocyclocheilus anshuiensis TaxID=1608454 RepID=UPI0007BA06D8|nr:PREDICTED: 28S ribosomal protein S10, mitochondrial isoform X2 [Sinocyclocheilus anshuiensis]
MAASSVRVLSKIIHGHFLPAAAVRHQTSSSRARVSAVPCPAVSLAEEPDALYQKLSVRVKGHDRCEPPKHTDKLALLKSVHIFKKHHVQYETRTHHRCIEISRVTGSSARVYLEYIQRNLPEGVAMEVTKTSIEKIPEHIQKPLWDDCKLEPSV